MSEPGRTEDGTDGGEDEAGADEVGAGERLEPIVVVEQPGRRITALSFVDDRYLAAASERIAKDEDPGQGRIDLFDRMRPGVYASVPVAAFARRHSLLELAVIAPAGEASGPELLVAARNRDGRVELLRLEIAFDEWSAFTRRSAAAEPVRLTSEQIEVETLAELDKLFGVDVGPGMVIYAAADGPSSELVLLDLDTRETRRLTENRVRDYLPRFVGDGELATFVSLMRVNISTTPFSVPRVLRVR